MATGTINLPPGFELEEQQPAQPAQQTGNVNLPPGFQLEQQQPPGPIAGTELGSTQSTPEEMENRAAEELQFRRNNESFLRSQQTFAIQKLPKADRLSRMNKLSPIHLLEAVSSLNPVTDRAARKLAVGKLIASGIPKEAIEDYITASKGPQGIKGIAKKEAIPTAFEIGGGLIGLAKKKPVRGAVAGRAVGEAVNRSLERIFITERSKGIRTDLEEGSFDTALAGLGEFASGKVAKGLKAIFKPAGKTKIGGLKAQEQLLKRGSKAVTQADVPNVIGEVAEIAKSGVGLANRPRIRPSQATTATLVETLDNISEKAFSSSQIVRAGELNRAVAFKKGSELAIGDIKGSVAGAIDTMGDDIVKQLTPVQVGAVLNSAIEGTGGAKKLAKGIYGPLYDQLDALTGSRVKPLMGMVDSPSGIIDPTTKKAVQVSAQIGETVENGVNNKDVIKLAKEFTDKVKTKRILGNSPESADSIKKVSELADASTFKESINNRSILLEQKRNFELLGQNKAAALAGEMSRAIDASMEQAAKDAGPEVFRQWRKANKVFKAVQDRFSPQIITKLAKEVVDKPELAGKTIFKDGMPTQILAVKRILLAPTGKGPKKIAADKALWGQLQDTYTDLLTGRATSSDGFIFGQKLLDGMDDMGEAGLKAIYGNVGKQGSKEIPRQVKALRTIGSLGQSIQKKLQGEGSMLIQIMQPAAAVGLVSGKKTAAALGVLGIPRVWAKMAATRKGSQLIINGLADLDKIGIEAVTPATQKLMRAYFVERSAYLKEQKELSDKEKEGRIEGLRKKAIELGARDFN